MYSLYPQFVSQISITRLLSLSTMALALCPRCVFVPPSAALPLTTADSGPLAARFTGFHVLGNPCTVQHCTWYRAQPDPCIFQGTCGVCRSYSSYKRGAPHNPFGPCICSILYEHPVRCQCHSPTVALGHLRCYTWCGSARNVSYSRVRGMGTQPHHSLGRALQPICVQGSVRIRRAILPTNSRVSLTKACLASSPKQSTRG